MAVPPSTDIVLAAAGKKCDVVYARRNDGTMEAKQWFDAQTDSIKRGFGSLIQFLADNGRITNEKLFKKLEGMENVWEFRKGSKRLFCVNDGNRWLLTHPYKKGHSKGHQTRAALQAITIAAEHREFELSVIKSKQPHSTEHHDDNQR